MGATNKTAELELSQYTENDKPTILGDYNSDMKKIDDGIKDVKALVATGNATATTAMNAASAAGTKADKATTDIAKEVTDRSAAVTALDTKTTTSLTGLTTRLDLADSKIADRYTKAESDGRFAPKPTTTVPHAVFLGSSNAVPGLWVESFASAMGWEAHNYSIGGGSFTGVGVGRFDNQLAAALADTSVNKSLVQFVFICDAGNDIRSQTASVLADASGVFSIARANYPNARIIMIPALWAATDRAASLQNTGLAVLRALQRNITELRQAAATQRVEIVEGTHTWHWDNTNYTKPGEVHFTTAGYTVIREQMLKYMRGEQVWNDTYWRAVAGGSDTTDVKVRRIGNVGYLSGSLQISNNVGIDGKLFDLPQGFGPMYRDILVPIVGAPNGRALSSLQLWDFGEVRAWNALVPGRYDVQVTYPIF